MKLASLLLGLASLLCFTASVFSYENDTFTGFPWTQDQIMSAEDTLKLLERIQQDRSFTESFTSPLDKIINQYRKFNHGDKTSADLLPRVTVRWVFTRDLISLFTIIINPSPHNERKPSVLVRSPYGPTSSNLADLYLLDGYVAILQDQRGAFLSSGFWDFWRKDSQDAYDVMEWIEKQDWSNGEVYTAGISADGCSALTQPLFNPPQLKGQFIVWASGEAYDTSYQGGAYRQSLLEGWLTFIGVFTRLHSLTVIDDIQKHESKDSYWDTLSLVDNDLYKNVNFTSVFWAGWFDIFQGPNIEAFNGYQTESNPSVRGSHWLYVGPAGHCVGLGDANFPGSFTFLPLQLSREAFRGETNGEGQRSTDKITLYVMGTALENQVAAGDLGNYWTSLPSWPKATLTPYYLAPSEFLSTSAPTISNSFESYLYDPRDPVPTQGGTNLSPPCGPKDLGKIESRSDVLVFTTPVLTKPVAIVGKVEAILYVSSDAIDTDFTVFVTDVHPDNSSILLQDGIIRMRWREGNVTPVYMTKGIVYQVRINLWYTAKIFNVGHRIRVLVSSSNDPHFSVNRNNGEFVRDGGSYIKAVNSIYHSSEYPSSIVFPVVDLAAIPENPEIARVYAVDI